MIHFFGIRHHGPGSARSVLQALETLAPDCLLIEGPPEGNSILEYVGNDDMQPPIAMLNYRKDNPQQAVFDPFAIYSPEWQALQYGSQNQIAMRFMDLALAHRFAIREQEAIQRAEEHTTEQVLASDKSEPSSEDAKDIQAEFAPKVDIDITPTKRQRDPLSELAEAAGYNDGERWWGHIVEERLSAEGVFEAIREAMTALRQDVGGETLEPENLQEAQREASMRKIIRKAVKDGFTRIAVICGAWHVPALQRWDTKGQSTADNKLLKGLPKVKVQSTWIPYTTGRLARQRGYGAGIASPGWYDHLWRYGNQAESAIRWLTRVAQLLRAEGLMASSAQVIDAVRLAESVAAVRGRAVVGLDELNEAAEAVFANGNPIVLRLIHDALIIDDTLGSVSDAVPATPLQLDVKAQQKSLRLKPNAVEKSLELDLRKPNDLARSKLFYRLLLLDIPWAERGYARSTGTFKEAWTLAWQPEYTVRLIEAGRYGQTGVQASSAKVKQHSQRAKNISELSALLDHTLLADLPEASQYLLYKLEEKAAEDNDLSHLMLALPKLIHVLRYGNVRTNLQHVDETSYNTAEINNIRHVAQGMFSRICIGLPNACHAIADDVARDLFDKIQQVHQAVKLLEDSVMLATWLETLENLTKREQTHPLLLGCSFKIRLDADTLTRSDAAKALGLALSDHDVTRTARWLEGFLYESGWLLVHDDAMFSVLDSWLATLSEDNFMRVLPLLRRTFGDFASPEKAAIGRKAKQGKSLELASAVEINETRGAGVMHHLATLLGVELETHLTNPS